MIDIVLVNWNAGALLCEAISSIFESGGEEFQSIIVVDNGSTDDSIRVLKEAHGSSPRLKIIENVDNKGFGAACNQGAALGSSTYVLFLNPDTRLLPRALVVPLRFMEDPKSADVGICGIQLVDETGTIAPTCARFPSVRAFVYQALGLTRLSWFRSRNYRMDEWDHRSDREVDQLIGAFFFVRRSLFEDLGGFDERFFVYFEEVDFSFRTRQAGWKSVYLTGAQAFHEGGGTSGQVKATRLFYSLRSRLLYGFKNFSLLSAWMLTLVTLCIEPLSRVVFSLVRGGPTDARNTLKAFRMLLSALPEIVGRRTP
jgi:GT2 family glycosyltransferase